MHDFNNNLPLLSFCIGHFYNFYQHTLSCSWCECCENALPQLCLFSGSNALGWPVAVLPRKLSAFRLFSQARPVIVAGPAFTFTFTSLHSTLPSFLGTRLPFSQLPPFTQLSSTILTPPRPGLSLWQVPPYPSHSHFFTPFFFLAWPGLSLWQVPPLLHPLLFFSHGPACHCGRSRLLHFHLLHLFLL